MTREKTRIFYFTTSDPSLQGDFQEVSTLIGLRNIYGDKVIDIPRKSVIYGDFKDSPKENLHGRGFTFYNGGVSDIDPKLREMRPSADDIIIYGTVDYGILSEDRDHGECKNVFYIDGGDTPEIKITPCFKRELFYSQESVYETGFGIPEAEIINTVDGKRSRLFPKTTPDIELMDKYDTTPKVHFHPVLSKYHFEEEEDYIKDISGSWFFPVTKRGGWDSLRPYQGCAYGSLVLFKDYKSKPELCSPVNFPTVSYSSLDELEEIVAGFINTHGVLTEEYYKLLSRAG